MTEMDFKRINRLTKEQEIEHKLIKLEMKMKPPKKTQSNKIQKNHCVIP